MWASRASVRERLDDFDGAFADLSRALELDPNDRYSWALRAFVRIRLKDPAGAVDDYSRSIELDPTDANAWMGRGRAYRALGERERAVSTCARRSS